jgi:hypothetical protein
MSAMAEAARIGQARGPAAFDAAGIRRFAEATAAFAEARSKEEPPIYVRRPDGAADIDPRDVTENALLQPALASVLSRLAATDPQAIKDMIRPDGTVRLFRVESGENGYLPKPTYVRVDPKILKPSSENGEGENNIRRALWPALIAEALKVYSSPERPWEPDEDMRLTTQSENFLRFILLGEKKAMPWQDRSPDPVLWAVGKQGNEAICDAGTCSYTSHLTLPFVVDGSETSEPVSIRDINQRHIGNCGFLSALGALAMQWPKAIHDMIRVNPATPDGLATYTVTLNKARYDENGKLTGFRPVMITVDEAVPAGAVAAPHLGVEIWPRLVEKAAAALNGGYSKITSVSPRTAFEWLTGRGVERVDVEKLPAPQQLRRYLQEGRMIVFDARDARTPEFERYAIAGANHAYTLTEIRNDGGKWRALFYNPWGHAHPKPVDVEYLPKIFSEAFIAAPLGDLPPKR